jgi:peroxiredoxin family protein
MFLLKGGDHFMSEQLKSGIEELLRLCDETGETHVACHLQMALDLLNYEADDGAKHGAGTSQTDAGTQDLAAP